MEVDVCILAVMVLDAQNVKERVSSFNSLDLVVIQRSDSNLMNFENPKLAIYIKPASIASGAAQYNFVTALRAAPYPMRLPQ